MAKGLGGGKTADGEFTDMSVQQGGLRPDPPKRGLSGKPGEGVLQVAKQTAC